MTLSKKIITVLAILALSTAAVYAAWYDTKSSGNSITAVDWNAMTAAAWRGSTDIYRSSGNVGIGTTSPGQKLTVAGIIESTSGGIKFPDSSSMITAFLPKGYLQRSKFAYSTTTAITISAGVYEANNELYEWNSQLTFTFGSGGSNAASTNLGASDWFYVYLDDSAIATAGTNVLTASELVAVTTEPTWSEAKHGWYNVNDRAIFAVMTNATSDITEFFHDGGDLTTFADVIVEGTVDIDTVWLDQSFTAPKFATKILIRIWQSTYISGPVLNYRVNGQAGTIGYKIKNAGSTNGRTNNQDIILTDGSQIAEFKADLSNTDAWDFKTVGFFLPTGI